MERKSVEQESRLIINECLCDPVVAKLMNLLCKYDKNTFIHSSNVSFMATQIALGENYERQLVEIIAIGGLLHDIGKMNINTNILNKKGSLDNNEWNIIKTHSLLGYQKVKNLSIPQESKEIILKHHERLDGSGYPYGMKSGDIPLYVRIISICDVYDAMTSTRPYKFSFLGDYAIEEMKNYIETEFDKDMLQRLACCAER